jgi:mono/diheme cytochrome c family protein
MNSRNNRLRLQTSCLFALFSIAGIDWTARFLLAQDAADATVALGQSFEQQARPFLQQNCVRCHNADTAMSGIRVDQLDAALEDRHLRLWEGIRKKIGDETMPPKGQPQPTSAERQRMVEWINRALDIARSRPTPQNGLVRRLTVSQYRNTLRELLLLEDDLTEILPPDAISKDGFVNNKETLQLSPLLLETYFEIAEEALKRSIIDPRSKPAIQNFRVDLGASVNPEPFPDPLVLGANSLLLDNKDFMVTQLTPTKPFPFEPFFMRTKYRFIEGYAGNDTVRGWREYDSIYHSVFACMRGSTGYPKGDPYSAVPQGLLLRPAIPNDEMFEGDGTYGPKANFKISLRELPDNGRFRVTVMAAKYNDGLMLDPGAPSGASGSDVVIGRDPKTAQTITIKKAGIYQVDLYVPPRSETPIPVDASRLGDGLSGSWAFDDQAAAGRLEGNARLVDSPFGKAVSLDGNGDSVVIPRTDAVNVGEGDFTVAAWIQPQELRRAGIISLGAHDWTHGWYLDIPDGKGSLRIETAGPDNKSNGAVSAPPGTIRANAWQHVAAVVRRGSNETRLYVNGYAVAKGQIGSANLDNPKMNLHVGRIPEAQPFRGELDEVRLYRRALSEAEIQALVQPGRQFAKPPDEKPQHVTLSLGDRQFSGILHQPAFLAVRLDAGALPIRAEYSGVRDVERIVLTPLETDQEIARRFRVFEKRSPRLGVHLGLRRDCGSTFAQVGPPQVVGSGKLTRFVFEGAIRNFPSPDVEKDNVNYLAGIGEIAVRSEFTDGRDMPRMLVKSVEFEGPFYDKWPPPSHQNIFVDSARKNDSQAYAREIIRTFASRAYRRPVTADEEAALVAVFQKSSAAGRSFQESIQDALQVCLTSPQFLFLIEKSSTPKPEPLDDYELASKLSYFLWNGPPDRKTLQLAAGGSLRKQLNAEVERMVGDARFSRFVQEFGSQWLSLDKFSVLEPDRKRFPRLTRDARAQLRQEPVQFLQHLIRNNLPLRNLVQSDFMVANEVVASYYDLADKTESGFQFVAIPHERRELGGVLTQAAIMAGLSDGRESNPVKRGAWLARRIIAEPPDDPPPNVPALPEDTQQLTLRERIERHRSQPGCFQCHTKIDPWGVAFEEFDAGGRLKQQPVDARSKLPDSTEVSGINDLQRYLAQDRIDQVAFSVLKHLATYATGRSLSYYELNRLKRSALKLKATDYRMRDMIRFVVNSDVFLEK